jgi:hypothetical protein
MVENSGKTLRADSFKSVNLPEPVRVETDPSGQPQAVRLPRRQLITAIDDRWRLDDEWWRSEPVSRLYWAVRLASGNRLVLYQDLAGGGWYRQSY